MKNYSIAPIQYRNISGTIISIGPGTLTSSSILFPWTITDANGSGLESGCNELIQAQYENWTGDDWPYLAECIATNIGVVLGSEVLPVIIIPSTPTRDNITASNSSDIK